MDVVLKIGSKKFEGWKSFSISDSMENLAASFRLSVTDNWVSDGARWPIIPGDTCELLLGGETLITGYVDEVSTSLDASNRAITVAGRSKAADLIDCSIDDIGNEFIGVSLENLATQLCDPFDIGVNKLTSTGPIFPNIRINPGDSIFEVLDKCARLRGVLLLSTPEGDIDITTPGSDYADSGLELGKNIKTIQTNYDFKNRFSSYKVKSQLASDEGGLGFFRIVGSAKDPNITRYRPLVFQAELQSDLGSTGVRAGYEAIVRAARSTKVTVVVDGFEQSPGVLWAKNQLVRTTAPLAGVSDELLISGVTFTLDQSNGSETSLELTRKDAFKPNPIVKDRTELLRKLLATDSISKPNIGDFSL